MAQTRELAFDLPSLMATEQTRLFGLGRRLEFDTEEAKAASPWTSPRARKPASASRRNKSQSPGHPFVGMPS
jgi:hypothetical protein